MDISFNMTNNLFLDKKIQYIIYHKKIKIGLYPLCINHKICPINCDTKSDCGFCKEYHIGLWDLSPEDIKKLNIYYNKLKYTSPDDYFSHQKEMKLINSIQEYSKMQYEEKPDDDIEIQEFLKKEYPITKLIKKLDINEMKKKYIHPTTKITTKKIDEKQRCLTKKIILLDRYMGENTKFTLFCDIMLKRESCRRMCKNNKCTIYYDKKCNEYCKQNYAHNLSELKLTLCKFGDKCNYVRYDKIYEMYADDIKFMCPYMHPKENLEKYCTRIGYNLLTDESYNPVFFTDEQKKFLVDKYDKENLTDYRKLEILQKIYDIYTYKYEHPVKLSKKDVSKEKILLTITNLLNFITKQKKYRYKNDDFWSIKVKYDNINSLLIDELLELIKKNRVVINIIK